MNSLRSYAISIYDGNRGSMVKFKVIHSITFDEIYLCKPESMEYIHALNEIIDSVMDLKVGKALYFQPNREDKNSKGIIVRL